MSDAVDQAVETREAAHAAICAGYELAKLLVLDGRRVRIRIEEAEDDITVQQRRFYHGPVLKQVSEQARDDGKRYVQAVWKEYYREKFLGNRWELVKGKPVEIRVSTEELGVKAYSEFIDKVVADAATEWGVEFHFDVDQREAVRYRTRRQEAAPT